MADNTLAAGLGVSIAGGVIGGLMRRHQREKQEEESQLANQFSIYTMALKQAQDSSNPEAAGMIFKAMMANKALVAGKKGTKEALAGFAPLMEALSKGNQGEVEAAKGAWTQRAQEGTPISDTGQQAPPPAAILEERPPLFPSDEQQATRTTEQVAVVDRMAKAGVPRDIAERRIYGQASGRETDQQRFEQEYRAVHPQATPEEIRTAYLSAGKGPVEGYTVDETGKIAPVTATLNPTTNQYEDANKQPVKNFRKGKPPVLPNMHSEFMRNRKTGQDEWITTDPKKPGVAFGSTGEPVSLRDYAPKPSAGGIGGAGGIGSAKAIQPGSPEFTTAQNLAYGKLTFSEFRTLVAYGRDPMLKLSIYAKATELNPNFNPAKFEMGYKFAANPATQRALAAVDNVMPNIDKIIELSNSWDRTQYPDINKFMGAIQFKMGNKTVSSIRQAQKLVGDEMGIALGAGTMTDMKLQLGLDVIDPNLPEDVFASNMVRIKDFLINRKTSLLDQMGIYGSSEMNPGGATNRRFNYTYKGKTYTFDTEENLKKFKVGLGIKDQPQP